MNKYYSLLGFGLLTAATLISCQEDIIESGENASQQEAHAYTAWARIQDYRTEGKETDTRANVQDDGKTFIWNKADEITVWNGETGNVFTISKDYDESFPSAEIPFYSDDADLEDGTSVWGIYPSKEGEGKEGMFSFELSGMSEQNPDFKPHLQETMYMVAQGTVSGNEIQGLSFRHLTSLFQFNISNVRPKQIIVKNVTVESSKPVFSGKLNLVDGTTPEYSEQLDKLVLNFGDGGILASDESLSGYMSFFPTTTMSENDELTFTVNYVEEGTEKVQVKTGTVGELYAGLPLAVSDGFQYVAGKRYVVNMDVVLNEDERGYVDNGDKNYTVYSAEGLSNLLRYEADYITDENTVITLDGEGDFDMRGADWTPIAEFRGTFDGNGQTISNFKIASEGSGGFITLNSGLVENLTLANVEFETNSVMDGADSNPNGLLVAKNEGTVSKCVVDGGAISISFTGNLGALVGHNTCVVADSEVTGNVNISTGGNMGANPRTGGLIGYNSGTIERSSVGREVSIYINGGSGANVGGLVGWNQNGKLTGCHAAASITTNEKAILAGGLIGVTASSSAVEITACYSTGSITLVGTGHSTIGGLIGKGADEWNPAAIHISGCYTTTVITGFPQNVGGFIGAHDSNKGHGLNCEACFYVSDKAQTEYKGVTKVDDVAGMVKHASEMNSSISETGLEYTENGGGENEPLILEVSGPGFGGPDFGDGDEI